MSQAPARLTIRAMPSSCADAAALLARSLAEHEPRLRALDEEASARPREVGKWAPRQVLGHLIDSAFNNYHRVIRAQQANELRFPGYQQEHWVDAGGYTRRPWTELIDLWTQVNRQFAHALAGAPAAHENTPCFVGEDAPVTLAFLAHDYVRHLEHHLRQVLDPARAAGQKYQPFADPS